MKVLFILLVMYCQSARCEIWPVHSIVDLCLISEVIVEARYIYDTDEHYVFTYREFNSNGSFDNTLTITTIHRQFRMRDDERFRMKQQQTYRQTNAPPAPPPRKIINFKNADQIIIFLREEKGILVPVFGGFRIENEGVIYFPAQKENPGKYSFQSDTTINYTELTREIIRCQDKVNELRMMVSMPFVKQQDMAFKRWIIENRDELLSRPPRIALNRNIGWGKIGVYFYYRNQRDGLKPEDTTLEELKEVAYRRGIITRDNRP